jgi:hypothetical protein
MGESTPAAFDEKGQKIVRPQRPGSRAAWYEHTIGLQRLHRNALRNCLRTRSTVYAQDTTLRLAPMSKEIIRIGARKPWLPIT